MMAEFIKDMVDENIQIQPSGTDLTVDKVFIFKEPGRIGFKEKHLPALEEAIFSDNYWKLAPGAYKIRFREIVKVPENMAGLCVPRSTLLRMGGFVACALWDPGYVGRGEALLYVGNPRGLFLEKDSRVAQLFYMEVKKPLEKTYKGSYQGEGLE
jgi:dUTP pyrophosphatase